MAFIHLDVRCLYAILICTAFGSTLSSNTEIKVNPPEDFEIVDPGYLGYLYLQWQPPLFLDNCEEHTVEYELKYRSIDSENWRTIITKNLLYKDGFDLNKVLKQRYIQFYKGNAQMDLKFRVHGQKLVIGHHLKEIWKLKFRIWIVYITTGNIYCALGNLEWITNFDTNYYLFYWFPSDCKLHEIMGYVCFPTVESLAFIIGSGMRAWTMHYSVLITLRIMEKNIGCRFPYLEEPDYKDFYICVNGSSKSQLIRPSYFIFQLQNIVKPLPPDYLNIIVKNSEDINLEWNIPKGPIPANCFIYEIKFTEDDTTWVTTTFENEMYVTRTSNESQEVCFLVRSKMNVYCTDDGIWSEWSEIECWRGVQQEEILTFLIPFAFILFLILLITCMLMNKQKALQRMIFQKKQEVFSRQETLC